MTAAAMNIDLFWVKIQKQSKYTTTFKIFKTIQVKYKTIQKIYNTIKKIYTTIEKNLVCHFGTPIL